MERSDLEVVASVFDRPPKAPELAILSALAHANDPDGLATVLAALDGAATLDEPRAGLYADLVMASLSEAVAKELEAMVLTGKYELQSDFAKRYFAEGREEGRAEASAAMLLRVVEKRGLELSRAQRSRVLGCRDVAQLERWLDRALEAADAVGVFDED